MEDFLKVSMDETNDLHRDINLSIPSLNVDIHADSYYLFLDIKNINPSYSGIASVLSVILTSWINKLNESPSGTTIYLPFDFSDEYIGCLRIRVLDDVTLKVKYGLTQAVMGVTLAPSFAHEFSISDNEFEADSDLEVSVNRLDFTSCIIKSINDLKR